MSRSTMTHAFTYFPQKPIGGCAVALLLVLALASSLSSPAAAQPARIVAVGDIHGDFDALVAILQQAKLIDARHRWTGRKATLVQTGDLLDRGPKSREVMDLLMALEKQARKKGGRVIVLLGNHEMMNLTDELRDVAGAEYASFADEKSPKRRRAAYQAYMELRKKRAQALNQPPPVFTPETQKEWMERHPLGFVERRHSFGPTGKYGRWLRQRQAIAQVGDVIFLHGGINPALASWKVEEINNRIKQEIKAFDAYKQYLIKHKLVLPFFTLDETTAAAREELEARNAELEQKTAEAAQAGKSSAPTAQEKQHLKVLEDFLGYGNWLSFHPQGPLWFRDFALWPEEVGAAHVADLLGNYGASAFVVGHTTQRDGQIHTRFGGKVFLIDTGMLASYYQGGRTSALEIQNGKFTAIYRGQRTVLFDRAATSLPSSKEEHKTPAEVSGSELASDLPVLATLQPPRTSAQVWLGPQGEPLPFTSHEEILEFLRTARVVWMKELGQGITRPRKVLLDKDGIRMHAIFHDVNVQKLIATFASGRREVGFRDTYLFECAAYELSRLLGLDNVPPVVERRLRHKKGSLRVWIENAITETIRRRMNITPPDILRWSHQIHVMRIFDNLIYNTDRNLGNTLIDPNWKVWMIDHTRAFRRFPELNNPKVIIRCERTLLEKLRTLDEAIVKQRLKKFLGSYEINALLKRRQKLVKYIEKLIQERGEEQVLYTHE